MNHRNKGWRSLTSSDSPFSKIMPIAWSNESEDVRDLHPLKRGSAIFKKMNHRNKGGKNSSKSTILDYSTKQNFSGFVRSLCEESSSTETSPRSDSYGGKHQPSTQEIKPQGPIK